MAAFDCTNIFGRVGYGHEEFLRIGLIDRAVRLHWLVNQNMFLLEFCQITKNNIEFTASHQYYHINQFRFIISLNLQLQNILWSSFFFRVCFFIFQISVCFLFFLSNKIFFVPSASLFFFHGNSSFSFTLSVKDVEKLAVLWVKSAFDSSITTVLQNGLYTEHYDTYSFHQGFGLKLFFFSPCSQNISSGKCCKIVQQVIAFSVQRATICHLRNYNFFLGEATYIFNFH